MAFLNAVAANIPDSNRDWGIRQSEKTNDTVEVILRYAITGQYESMWALLLPEVERTINTLPSTSTGVTPHEILYGEPPSC